LKYIIYLVALALKSTYRFEYKGEKELQKLKINNRNYLLAVFHQNLLPAIFAQVKDSYVVIVSRSKDANCVAFTCEKLGHKVTRGSSKKEGRDKGGKEAKDQMVEWLIKGFPGAVTIDGPKGPAKKVKPGIAKMAIESNSVIVPYTVKASRYIEFKSWDRFQLPLPFSKIIVHYGNAIDPENYQNNVDLLVSEVEKNLNVNSDFCQLEALSYKRRPAPREIS
jgi:lysophospholipid acyltransferase (LPLAT)-like uncharacterized protein